MCKAYIAKKDEEFCFTRQLKWSKQQYYNKTNHIWQKQFRLHWSRHRCRLSGCQTVHVWDANQKNRCKTCANWLRYDFSVHGFKWHKGCTNYPYTKSQYCKDCRHLDFTEEEKEQNQEQYRKEQLAEGCEVRLQELREQMGHMMDLLEMERKEKKRERGEKQKLQKTVNTLTKRV